MYINKTFKKTLKLCQLFKKVRLQRLKEKERHV